MKTEIKCIKPKVIKYFGIAELYARYTNRFYKWQRTLPDNGDKIEITWMPSCINGQGEPNPYIGMKGIVENMNKNEGSFVLNCGNCYLTHPSGNFNYIKYD